jgi:hypothetical protein
MLSGTILVRWYLIAIAGRDAMNLKDHFDDRSIGISRDAEAVSESDWLPFCDLPVPTGGLWVGDPLMAWAEAQSGDGCVIDVPQGKYRIDAKVLESSDGGRVVSRVRVVLQAIESFSLGDVVGEAGTDSCQMGVADQNELKAAFMTARDNEYEECIDLIEQQTSEAVGIVQPDPDGNGVLAFVSNGTDGGGAILELLSNGERVGIEFETYPAPVRMRCPVESCAGWVTGSENAGWTCEECGYEWYSQEEVNEAISEIIQNHSHRAKCYMMVADNWGPAPIEQEPKDYEALVETELD